MKLAEVIATLEQIAPTARAAAWDNVGLLAGDPEAQVSRALLTIDYTSSVAEEARAKGCELVIAYHPPIFHALKRLAAGNLVFEAIRAGIAIYSPHTALDIAEGGTNDMLADVLGLADPRPLRLAGGQSTHYKLVTFVPEDNLEAVSAAIFAAGAGKIGNYSSCSFRSAGEGTFFGQAGAHPAVGESGRLEHAEEIRLETIVEQEKVEAVVRALRKAHRYEEAAFDLLTLAAPPSGQGMGRAGALANVPRAAIFERIKAGLGVRHLLIAGPSAGNVSKAAVCAGSCGELLQDAIGAGVELFLTGEVRHHDALAAATAGMTVVCALHSNSERPVLARLQSKLRERIAGLQVEISAADRDPFAVG